IVTDTMNGCISNQSILVDDDYTTPNISILGYPGFSSAVPIDELTCTNDTITLECFSTTINVLIYWTDSSGILNLGSSLSIDSIGTYYLSSIDTMNGCSLSTSVFMTANFTYPDAHTNGDSTINCSSDSANLQLSSTYPDVAYSWNGIQDSL